MAALAGMLKHLPILTGLVQLVCSLIYTPLVAWLCFSDRWWITESTVTQCISLYDSTMLPSHHYYDYQALVFAQKFVMFFGIWVMVSSVGGMLLHIVQHVMHIKRPLINYIVMLTLGAVIAFACVAVGVETYYTTNAFWMRRLNMHRYRAAAAFLWFSLMAQVVEFVWRLLQLNRASDVVESDAVFLT